MHHLRRVVVGLTGVLPYLAVPAVMHAQAAGGVELFGSLDNSDAITRTLGGLSLSLGTPYVGIRGSGAIGQSTLATQFGAPTTGPSDVVWSTNADLLAAFATAREHLNPGGVFIFDCWYGPAVLAERPSVRIKRMEDGATSITENTIPSDCAQSGNAV